jgi:hypothetical protein
VAKVEEEYCWAIIHMALGVGGAASDRVSSCLSLDSKCTPFNIYV